MVSKEEIYRNSLFETLRELEDRASDFVCAPGKDFTRMRKLSFIDTMKAGLIYSNFIGNDYQNRIIADAKYKPINNLKGSDYFQILAYI